VSLILLRRRGRGNGPLSTWSAVSAARSWTRRRCGPAPAEQPWVEARFLPVGLSVGVAVSSASPSQSKDSRTR